MQKYQLKKRIVTATPFEWGMESGVRLIQGEDYIQKDRVPRDEQGEALDLPESQKYPGYLVLHEEHLDNRGHEQGQWRAYIDCPQYGGHILVNQGDLVVHDKDTEGNDMIYPVNPDTFLYSYEEFKEPVMKSM